MKNNKKPHGKDSLLIQPLPPTRVKCGNVEEDDISNMRNIILMADKQIRGKYEWVRAQ